MEQTISQLQLTGLQIKLTSEKLYIQTNVSQEAIALRSINGIGVVDLVDEYNKELTTFKALKQKANQGLILMIVSTILAIFVYFQIGFAGVILCGVGIIGGFIAYNKHNQIQEPSLKSSVRIMITGTTRDFTFNKAYSNASDVANFVAQVENTLSAFHKN
jgi:hypothetical protein